MTAEELLDRKQEWRELHKRLTLTQMAQRYAHLQDRQDDLKEQLAAVNVEFDLLRFEAIPEKMDEDGIKNINLDGIGKVTVEGELFVEVAAGDRPEFYEWLDNMGMGDIVQKSIAPQTLKAFAKAQMRKGTELPGVLKVRPASKAKLTRSK